MITDVLADEQDLRGIALNAQRFRMLSDIAEELKERVVFPVCFDLTISIRNALQKKHSVEDLRQLLRLDPLVGAKVLRVAGGKAKRQKQPPIADLEGAFAMLDAEAILRVATEMSTAQLLRSRFLADFSDWVELLWERSLSMAATAHVLAEKFTDIPSDQAMFAALCHELPLYYMLYRAVQYPELRARPASLKHLVVGWHGGIAESLLSSLDLPKEIVEAVCSESQAPLTRELKTLSDIVQISNALAGSLSESPTCAGHSSLDEHYLGEQAEIRAFRQVLRRLYSPAKAQLA